MSAWSKRQNRSNPQGSQLRFEALERREMLSANYVFNLTSGNTVSFKDADGTTVKVKLMGSGSGSFTLTNGLQTGAPIAAMTIAGTDATSQLKITAAGGGDNVSTFRTLTVTPAVAGTALSQLSTSSMNVASGGLLTFNGNVGGITLNSLNNGGSIDVNGNLNALTVNSIGSNTSIDVSGTLGTFKVQTLGGGSGLAEVAAQTLTALTVNRIRHLLRRQYRRCDCEWQRHQHGNCRQPQCGERRHSRNLGRLHHQLRRSRVDRFRRLQRRREPRSQWRPGNHHRRGADNHRSE
jgi:hypothetical protein